MRTSSSSASVLPFTPETTTPKAPASSDDSSQSFADVLHQHGGDTSSDSNSPSAPAKPQTSATALTTPLATPAPLSATPVPAPAPIVPSTIASLTTHYAATAPVVPSNATPVTTNPKPAVPFSKPVTTGVTAGSDLASMLVQATVLASHLNSAAVTSTVAVPKAPATKDPAAPAAPDTATLIAQASLANPAPATTASVTMPDALAKISTLAGKEIPVLTSAKTLASLATKEKKSPVQSSERSFLQSGTASSKDDANPLDLLGTAMTSINYQAGHQPVTTQSEPVKNAADSLAASAASGIGTDRVEKKSTMTTEQNLPEMITAPNTGSTSAPAADVNILLSSNHDFEDAIKQVVHIAQLSEASASRTPTRIAIELQTPPGAIVNVYVSKQNDQYRAQLSTNDPVALSWVQDKITSLRQSNDLGVEVKWLPVQMESTSISATTTSSNDSNLNWNRDGQNPQNYQQPDDRSQSQRQNESSDYEDLAEVEAESFASFVTAGGAA